jgi:hypothetical protein
LRCQFRLGVAGLEVKLIIFKILIKFIDKVEIGVKMKRLAYGHGKILMANLNIRKESNALLIKAVGGF